MAKRRKARAPKATRAATAEQAQNYQHPDSKVLLRPDVGTQAQFTKKKPPQRFRYDSSLSPSLEWDSSNTTDDRGALPFNDDRPG